MEGHDDLCIASAAGDSAGRFAAAALADAAAGAEDVLVHRTAGLHDGTDRVDFSFGHRGGAEVVRVFVDDSGAVERAELRHVRGRFAVAGHALPVEALREALRAGQALCRLDWRSDGEESGGPELVLTLASERDVALGLDAIARRG